jgi:hypothetical protein
MKHNATKQAFRPDSLRRTGTARTVLLRMAADQERAARIDALKETRPDLTWRRIADHVGVSERSAYNWKVTGGIDYENAKKLAGVFDVDVDYIWRGPAEEDRAPSPFAGQDALADRFDALEQRVIEQLAEHARKVEDLLARQSDILASIETRLGEDRDIRDEIQRHGQGILQGRSEDAPNPAPAPPRSKGAATKRAAKQRTP